jgi:hypothetical protein
MVFKDRDVFEGYKADRRDGLNRRRYNRHEGRKKAFYVWVKGADGHAQSIVKFITKDVQPEKVKLRGPADLKESKPFSDILRGKKLSYSFLNDTENRILTMRSLGKTRSQIARALSGGRSRRSYTSNQIKYLLQKSRQKIRENEGDYIMANCSFNIPKQMIDLIDNEARGRKMNRSELVTEACKFYLNTQVDGVVELDQAEYMKLYKQISKDGNWTTWAEMDSFLNMEKQLKSKLESRL